MRTNTKLSKKDRVAIINRILRGEKYSPIAREFGVVTTTVALIGQHLGIRKHTNEARRKWTASDIDSFLRDKGSTIRRVSSDIRHCKTPMVWKCGLCNHEWSQIFDVVKRRVKEGGGKGCHECGCNEYTVFHDFLEEPYSPEAAYFIGVFVAAGVQINNDVIKITSPHKSQLEKIQEFISCTYPIKTVYRCKSHMLSFKSPKMAKVLRPLKKTKGEKIIPKVIDKNPELFSHFLRGYVDFHGFIEEVPYDAETKVGHSTFPRFTLTGSYAFLQKIQKKYQKTTEACSPDGKARKGCLRKPEKHEFYIVGVESAYYFMNWIYNSEVNPMRYISNSKYDAYLNLKARFTEKQDRKEYLKVNQEIYGKLQEEFHSLTGTTLAKKHNVHQSVIYKIRANKHKQIRIHKKHPASFITEMQECYQRQKEVKRLMKELVTKVTTRAKIQPTWMKTYHPAKETK